VDVPGHERFIKNMLAGVGGIDLALLVIAADEGVMPQTREHLAILDLLEISQGVVAITKRDLVEEDWLELVKAEVEDVLGGTSLAGAPLIPVSSTTGEGLEDLLIEMDRLLTAERHHRQTGWPRLPVDRVFTMSGFGTVVTGTLIDGELRVGQEVELLPGGRRARIRGLQSHRRRVDVAPAGTRVAVNLSAVATEEIERGQVLTAPGWLSPTRVMDVRVRIVEDAPRALPHNALVTFHTGAAEALGRVALLDRQELPPGESGWAQIRLDRPVAVVKGDPFIVRLPSPSITVGGGTVVDEHPKRHRRFQDRVIAQLGVLDRGSPEEVLLQTLQNREPAEVAEVARRSAHTVPEALELLRGLVERGAVLVLGDALGASSLLISAGGWSRLAGSVTGDLATYHRDHHLRRGIPKEEMRKRLGLDPRVFAAVERELLLRGAIAEEGPLVRLPSFQVVFSPEEEERAAVLARELEAAGASPASRSELQTRCGVSDELLQSLVDRGILVEVAQDLVYLRDTYDQLVDGVRRMIQDTGTVTVGQVRDAFSTSRKYALALLEHLDQRRVTKRVGDERVLA
jgi:selenocysteine-specific elongation factor